MAKISPAPNTTTLLLYHRLVIATLLVIIAVQYFMIRDATVPPNAKLIPEETKLQSVVAVPTIAEPALKISSFVEETPQTLPVSPKLYKGVAVTTFLGAPKWFQNRYTLMVNQVLAMIEDDWVVQIFYDPAQKMAREGVAYPGIQRQMARGRVLLSPLPSSMKKIKKNNLLLSSWFWQNIVAENVLLFGGTTALCANTHLEVSNFTSPGKYDYIGTPWGQFGGLGGEGGISIRNRTVMESVVAQYERDVQERGKAVGAAREDSVIVRSLLERKARVASKQVRTYNVVLFDSFLKTLQYSCTLSSSVLNVWMEYSCWALDYSFCLEYLHYILKMSHTTRN